MLADSDTYIWYQATDSFDDRATRSAMALLSSAERDNCSRFAFERDRRDYAAAHALLRSALSRYMDAPAHAWQFLEGAGGKPSLLNTGRSPLSFNLSHTHGLVACIVAPGIDVGIDVERVDPRIDHNDLADSFFSPMENSNLRKYSAHRRVKRFFELWTLKEAYLKAIGKGLSHPLNTITFLLDESAPIIFVPPVDIDPCLWRFALFEPTPYHVMAVALCVQSGARCHTQATSADDNTLLPPTKTSCSC